MHLMHLNSVNFRIFLHFLFNALFLLSNPSLFSTQCTSSTFKFFSSS